MKCKNKEVLFLKIHKLLFKSNLIRNLIYMNKCINKLIIKTKIYKKMMNQLNSKGK
jgi:hypothetical protein